MHATCTMPKLKEKVFHVMVLVQGRKGVSHSKNRREHAAYAAVYVHVA